MNTVTEPALNTFFSRLTTYLPWAVFSVSVIAALVDIFITNAKNAEYSVTCFLLDMIEVAFLTVNFFIRKTGWYKGKTKEQQESFDKRQQIVDNVMAEVLLYPTILCSLFSICVEVPFFPENFLPNEYESHMVRLLTFYSQYY